jgi:hypothetical protein
MWIQLQKPKNPESLISNKGRIFILLINHQNQKSRALKKMRREESKNYKAGRFQRRKRTSLWIRQQDDKEEP